MVSFSFLQNMMSEICCHIGLDVLKYKVSYTTNKYWGTTVLTQVFTCGRWIGGKSLDRCLDFILRFPAPDEYCLEDGRAGADSHLKEVSRVIPVVSRLDSESLKLRFFIETSFLSQFSQPCNYLIIS
jgi:hypothetical protein